jgi:hypothetical protein
MADLAKLMKAFESDSARLRMAYQNTGTNDPLKLLVNSIDGRIKRSCNLVRLIAAKESFAGSDTVYSEKVLNSQNCRQ